MSCAVKPQSARLVRALRAQLERERHGTQTYRALAQQLSFELALPKRTEHGRVERRNRESSTRSRTNFETSTKHSPTPWRLSYRRFLSSPTKPRRRRSGRRFGDGIQHEAARNPAYEKSRRSDRWIEKNSSSKESFSARNDKSKEIQSHAKEKQVLGCVRCQYATEVETAFDDPQGHILVPVLARRTTHGWKVRKT